MPTNQNVEERIVEMRIDNKKFESGAKQTISTLEKLEKALGFKGTNTEALEDIEKSMSKFDASPAIKGLEKIQASFSALEVAGLRVVSNLTDSIYNFAAKTIKSLTIDQVTAGWNKYERMIESTQTIMAATADNVGEGLQWETQEEQMVEIQKYLDGLLWYADETSYSFSDMTDNLGKFLSAGVDLENAYRAMMGISSWGASAGAKPAEVSRALYNISQALGTGAMKVVDWRSIENANMGILAFKQNVIDSAVRLGKLQAVTDDVSEGYVSMGVEVDETGHIIGKTNEEVEKMLITAENFRDSLSDGWFDKDVMEDVFERYGRFAELLRQTTSTNYGEEVTAAFDAEGNAIEGLTGSLLEATQMLELLDKYRDSLSDPNKVVDWEAWANEAGFEGTIDEQVEQLQGLVEALDAVGIEYSETGFRMGQEAKTFTDAIEATKDAVSSQWMKSFQFVFGDYMQAKEFWTSVTGELWDIFAASGQRRNQILKEWSRSQDAFGRTGRDYLLAVAELNDEGEVIFQGALWDLLDAIRSITKPIADAWDEIFGLGDVKEAGNKLQNFTKRFKEFTQTLGFSESAQESIKSFFRVLFSILKVGVQITGEAIKGFLVLTQVLGEIGDGFLRMLDGELSFVDFLKLVKDQIVSLIPTVDDFQNLFNKLVQKAKNFIPTEEQLLNFFRGIKNNAKSGYNAVKNWFSAITMDDIHRHIPSMERVREIYHQITDYIWKNYPTIAQWLHDLKETSLLGMAFNGLINALKNIGSWLENLPIQTEQWRSTLQEVRGFFESIVLALFGDPNELADRVRAAVTIVVDTLKEEFNKLTFIDIYKAFKAIGLGALLVDLAGVVKGIKDVEKEIKGIPESIAQMFGDLGDAFQSLGQSFKTNAYIKVAIAIALLAGSVVLLSRIDEDKLTHTVTVLGLLFVLMARLTRNLDGASFFSGNNYDKGIRGISDIAAILIGLGIAVASIVGSIRILVNLEKSGGSLEKAATTVGQIILVLAAVVALFSQLNNAKLGTSTSGIAKTASAMSLVAFSVRLLVKPIDQLSELYSLDDEAFKKALGALGMLAGGLTAIISVFSLLNHKKLGLSTVNILSTAGAIAIVAVAVRLLISPIKQLTKLSNAGADLDHSIWIIVALMAAMTAMVAALSKINTGKLLASAGAMAISALAIDIMMPALLALTGVIAGAIALIPWDKLTKKMGNFWKMLAGVAGVVAVVLAFAAAIKIMGTGVLRLGAGVAAISASVFLFSLGVAAVAAALKLAASALPEFLNGILESKRIITENLSDFLDIISAILLGIAIVVIGRKVQIAEAFGQVGLAVLQKIQGMSPAMTKTLGALIAGLGLYVLGVIPELTSFLVKAVIILLDSLATSIEENKPSLVSSITRIIKTVLEVVSEVLDNIFNKEFISDLNVVEKILLGFGALKISGSGISQLTGQFSALGKVIGGAGEAGGLVSKLTFAYHYIQLLVAAAGGLATVGPVIGTLAAGVYAWQNVNSQHNQFKQDAFAGLDPNDLQNYAVAIDNARQAVEKAQEDYNNMALYAPESMAMVDEELSARQTVLNNLYSEFAQKLGITTEELRAQIEAANGDISQIEVLIGKTGEYNGELDRTAYIHKTARDLGVEGYEDVANAAESASFRTAGTWEEARQLLMTRFGEIPGFMEYLSGSVNTAGATVGENGAISFLNGLISKLGDSQTDELMNTAGLGPMYEIFKGAQASTDENAEVIANNAAAGIINTLLSSDISSSLFSAGESNFNSYYSGFASAGEIHSPSRRMAEAANYTILGLLNTLKNNESKIYSEGYKIGDDLNGAIEKSMAQVGLFANENFSISPLITPVVDMSNINSAANKVSGVFSSASIGLAGDFANSVSHRLSQVERVASNMEAANQTINNGDNITFNIYASDGMDENAIADAVMSKMQTRFAQRRVAFG